MYLCPERFAEATATFVGGGPDVDLLARGSLDGSGAGTRLQIDDILAGNMPGIAPVGSKISSINDEVGAIDLNVSLTSVDIADGSVTLAGAPRDDIAQVPQVVTRASHPSPDHIIGSGGRGSVLRRWTPALELASGAGPRQIGCVQHHPA